MATRLKLKRLDLRKSDKHNHPDVVPEDRYYLARVGDSLYLGTFSKQWYGLNFDCDWGVSGMQFDAPGTNRSDWKELWEIQGIKP